MDERIIEGPECIAEGIAFLTAVEPRFASAFEQTGELPLRLRKDGFSALLDAIVSQQISVAAADSIWAKLADAKLTSARAVAQAAEDELRACGLSRPKIRYAKALAGAGINYRGLHRAPMDEVVDRLTAVTGIGKWTAEIYAMFSLGRADGFAAGDLALQEAARILFRLKERPTERQLEEMAAAWRPWRSVAARQLWAYYRIAKQREGIRQ